MLGTAASVEEASHHPYCHCLQSPATRCNGCRTGRYVHLLSRGREKMLWERRKYTQEIGQGCLSPIEELYTLWGFLFFPKGGQFLPILFTGMVSYDITLSPCQWAAKISRYAA